MSGPKALELKNCLKYTYELLTVINKACRFYTKHNITRFALKYVHFRDILKNQNVACHDNRKYQIIAFKTSSM